MTSLTPLNSLSTTHLFPLKPLIFILEMILNRDRCHGIYQAGNRHHAASAAVARFRESGNAYTV